MEVGEFRVAFPAFVPERTGESAPTCASDFWLTMVEESAGVNVGLTTITLSPKRATWVRATFLRDRGPPLESCGGKI